MDNPIPDFEKQMDAIFKRSLWKRIWRPIKFFFQRRTRGWDDSDTWGLDSTIARFVVPRLKRFKELNNGYPPQYTPEGWDTVLDEIIFALEACQDEGLWYEGSKEDQEKYAERVRIGLELFGKHFRDLWW